MAARRVQREDHGNSRTCQHLRAADRTLVWAVGSRGCAELFVSIDARFVVEDSE